MVFKYVIKKKKTFGKMYAKESPWHSCQEETWPRSVSLASQSVAGTGIIDPSQDMSGPGK